MKTLGLILVLSAGVLVMILSLVPIGVMKTTSIHPEYNKTEMGSLLVGEITIRNDGFFTRTIELPELVACIGDEQVPLESWTSVNGSIVRGSGQLRAIEIHPQEQGMIYIIATDHSFYERMQVYERTAYFSCLNPGTASLN